MPLLVRDDTLFGATEGITLPARHDVSNPSVWPELEFSRFGDVSGTDGCNRLSGSYTLTQADINAGGISNVFDVSAPITLGVTLEEVTAGEILVILSASLDVVVEILSGKVKWWYDIGVYSDSGKLLKFDTVWEDTWSIVNSETSFSF